MPARIWPAAWLTNSAYNSWPPEIDYFEVSTSTSTLLQNVMNPGSTDYSGSVTGVDMSTYHTFGCDWQANTVTFYVDGVLKSSVSRTLAGNQYLLLDMATRTSASFTSASVYFDYLRVWQ